MHQKIVRSCLKVHFFWDQKRRASSLQFDFASTSVNKDSSSCGSRHCCASRAAGMGCQCPALGSIVAQCKVSCFLPQSGLNLLLGLGLPVCCCEGLPVPAHFCPQRTALP